MYAVVLWDWVISLPREWRFVNTPCPSHPLFINTLIDLAHPLDPRQNCVSLLPVSFPLRLGRPPTETIQKKKILGDGGSPVPAFLFCGRSLFGNVSEDIQGTSLRPPFPDAYISFVPILDPCNSSVVEPSRLRRSVRLYLFLPHKLTPTYSPSRPPHPHLRIL